MDSPISRRSYATIPASIVSKRTVNPIRNIVDNLKVAPNPDLPMISLALGDPTIFGNLKTADICVNEVINQLKSFKSNGYPPSTGYEHAREAVATAFTTPEAPLTSKDVIITSGCSGALELCIGVLANEGQNILLPRPGFSLYQTLSESKGIECRYYNLKPEKSWEVDIKHLISLIDENTAAVLINNPSNPCGSVYSQQHLKSILAVAEEYALPIIADEIYAEMAFAPNKFHAIASLTSTVPVLTVGGLAKRYLVPGWRVGWILIHDRNGLFKEVRKGLVALSQIILGANSLVQSTLPKVLLKTPQSFYHQTMNILEENAKLSGDVISKIPGLVCVVPQGAMYLMVGIDLKQFKDFKSDLDFTEKLVAEKSVLCLPGQCFGMTNFFRIVFTSPKEKLLEAYERIRDFCSAHHV